MYSKRFTIENTDLTSGEVMLTLPITVEHTASNNSRTEYFYPAAYTCLNKSGQDISLVFLTSGELATYQADRTNYDGIIMGFDTGTGQQHFYTELSKSHYVNVIADDTLSGEFEISFFNYVSKG